MKLIDKLKIEMNLFDEIIRFAEFLPQQQNYKNIIYEKFADFKEYIEFLKSNESVYFSVYNPNLNFNYEDYFALYSVFEGYDVKQYNIDWSEDEKLMVLGCIGQETYLFSYGKEVYAFPQISEYEPENLIKVAENVEELLNNKDVFDRAMKYSDLLQCFFEDEDEYEEFLNN